jgi:hypothetical protein
MALTMTSNWTVVHTSSVASRCQSTAKPWLSAADNPFQGLLRGEGLN